jgi:hypothetical protein
MPLSWTDRNGSKGPGRHPAAVGSDDLNWPCGAGFLLAAPFPRSGRRYPRGSRLHFRSSATWSLRIGTSVTKHS